MPKRLITILLILLSLDSWGQGFIPEALFSISSSLDTYSPSYQGYGWLTPTGISSEAGLVSKEAIACESRPPQIDNLRNELLSEQFLYLNLMNTIFNEEKSAVIGWECLNEEQGILGVFKDFKRLFSEKGYFYQKSSGRDRYIFSNDKKLWGEVSGEVRGISDKYLALKESSDPLRTLFVIYTLEFLKNKKSCIDQNECLDELNLELMLTRSHPLLKVGQENSLYEHGVEVISEVLRKDRDKLKEYFKGLNHHLKLTEYKRIISRRFKFFLRKENRAPKFFKDYILAHKESRQNLIQQAKERLCLGKADDVVTRQVFAEKGEVPCLSPKGRESVTYQCSGVKVGKNFVNLSGHFYLQGFLAFRDYKILKSKEGPKVEMIIPVVRSHKLNIDQLELTLSKWQRWVNDFYNTSSLADFDISFIEVEEDREDTITLHQCWNTSRQSDDCNLGTQPSAKNYTIDMKKDALLEEVGHRMGLFDEYSMYYYLFNPQGARDSFMVAPSDYRLYPHHIEQILAPSLICKKD